MGGSNFKVKMALEKINTYLLQKKICSALLDSSGWRKMPQVWSCKSAHRSLGDITFCHLEGGRGGVSNDRVAAGEGQESIQLDDKGQTRANQRGNEGVCWDKGHSSQWQLFSTMDNDPGSRRFALVLPKPACLAKEVSLKTHRSNLPLFSVSVFI